jgi:hypothetical protein
MSAGTTTAAAVGKTGPDRVVVPVAKGTFFPDPAPHPVNKPVRMKTTANLRVNTTPVLSNFSAKTWSA